jgi:hypothetical protein
MKHPRLAFFLLAALAAPVIPAQAASYTFFGEACGNSFLPFVVQDPPRLGQRFVVESGVSCNGGCADGSVDYFFLTGDSNVSFRGMPLPFDLTRIGLQVCGLLRVSVLHVAMTQGANQHDRGTVAYPIPNDPCLLGASFYQQVLVVSCSDGECNRFLSRGGHGVIGW